MAEPAGWGPRRVRRSIEGVVVDFFPDEARCPACGEALEVQKTRRRCVVTLAEGEFIARETLRRCPNPEHLEPPVFGSSLLRRLTPAWQRYGWDLIVHVGRRRWLDHRQRDEIRAELSRIHGIDVSTGTISVLSDRFLCALQRLHRARAAVLSRVIEKQGGYSLHIDGTHETSRGGLFVCVDGFRQWVLASGRIRSERAEYLEPIITGTVERFGDPVAVVRDMSKACARAVESLTSRGIRDFICHYHFVADVGRDLFRRPHDRLKRQLRRSKVRPELKEILGVLQAKSSSPEAFAALDDSQRALAGIVYWALHGNGKKTPRFPFGLPHLERFCRIQATPTIVRNRLASPLDARVRPIVERLDALAASVQDGSEARKAVRQLDRRWKLFEELREILKLPTDPTEKRQAVLAELEARERKSLEKDLEAFAERMKRQIPEEYSRALGSPHRLICQHLNRYSEKLVGHPEVLDEEGNLLFKVDRTNNCLEQMIGRNKQGLRRTTGRRHLRRDLEDLPAQVVLTENLRDPQYLALICDPHPSLSEALAALAPQTTSDQPLRPRPRAHLKKWVKSLQIELLPPTQTSTPRARAS